MRRKNNLSTIRDTFSEQLLPNMIYILIYNSILLSTSEGSAIQTKVSAIVLTYYRIYIMWYLARASTYETCHTGDEIIKEITIVAGD